MSKHDEVKKILEEAYGKDANGMQLKDSSGNPLVGDETFKIDTNSQEIKYWVYPTVYCVDQGKRYIAQGDAVKITYKIARYTKGKAFLFFLLDTETEYIFSLEIIDFPDGIETTVSLCQKDQIDQIKLNGEDIVRIENNKNYYYIVAIKIGPQNKRDYTALKHYIISSDNRTYNKVIRNTKEYITVNNSSQNIPENKTELPHNLLVSGAPGTGKSHFLDVQAKKAGGLSKSQSGEDVVVKDSVIDKYIDKYITEAPSNASPEEQRLTAIKAYCDTYVTRVTFYEDYSYENFVGCYKPVPGKGTADIEYAGQKGCIKEDKITYEFVSGPFTDVYVKAKSDENHSYYLIIEEINRAKAASVFGDMFQLLDRKGGISEYEIKPDSALDDYLKENLSGYRGMMKLPPNMYLWATMNSADQGVMPLDSAFKRRWAQMYMDINPQTGFARSDILILPSQNGRQKVLWENLRSSINSVILNNGFDEDRCIGSWYFSAEEIGEINVYFSKTVAERINMVNPFIDKLLYYLRQDLFRRNPGAMFKSETTNVAKITMSDLRRRVRQDESIENILNFDGYKDKDGNPLISLKWENAN